ncbi:MAG: hypothetical protein NVSMB18_37040 [Acetobacteraceae bacterium]
MDGAHVGRPIAHAMSAAWRFVRREPLIHFVVFAGLLFAIDAVLHPPDRNARVITVTRAMREAMATNFDEDRERRATPDELNEMVEHWVASEILYREGKLLGVDRGDDTIRDRIAFKLQLMIFSQLEQPNPTGEELRAWFEQHRDRFDEPERASFYLSLPTDEAAARRSLEAIQAGQDPEELKRTTRAMIGRPLGSIAPVFGEEFRDGLLKLPVGTWSVLHSKEGWHVVRLDSRRPGEPARFEDVHDQALRIYQTDAVRERAWEAVKRLRTNYQVRYEP